MKYVNYGGYSNYGSYGGFYQQVVDVTNLNDACAYEIFAMGKHYKESPQWMQKKSHDDSCLECPTPIVKKRSEVAQYFLEFEMWTKRSGLTLDLQKAEEALGGCHIHISTSGLGKARRLFYQNIINFITNNPELNWGFNDPNDVDNANSLLVLAEQPYLRGLRIRFAHRREERRELRRIAREDRNRHRRARASRILEDNDGNTLQIVVQNTSAQAKTEQLIMGVPAEQREAIADNYDMVEGDSFIEDFGDCGTVDEATLATRHQMPRSRVIPEETIKTSRYEMAIISPGSTNKCGAINFNSDYKTVEFRIFDQPINLTQHLLHAEIAQRIFHYCLKKAQKKEAIELKIGPSFFKKFDKQKSIDRFNECLKIIKVDPARCTRQIANIHQRFDWYKENPKYGYLK